MFRTFVAVAALFVCGTALADSWMPPEQKTYTSPDGKTRVVVTPRALQNQRAYFEDKVDEKDKAGQAPQGPSQAMAEVQRRDGNVWRPVHSFALVNDVSPVEALVSNEGRVVTLDNWHSMGWGDDVVVLYDSEGKLVRKQGLEDFLPEAWRRHLIRSVSSLWWRGEATIDADGASVRILLAAPGADHDAQPSVPVHLSLVDGSVSHEAASWDASLQRVEELEAKRRDDWAALRIARAKPLSPPPSNDQDAWDAYRTELRDRTRADEGHLWFALMFLPKSDGMHDAESFRFSIDELAQANGNVDGGVAVSPDSHALAKLLAERLRAAKPGSMAGKTLLFLATPEDRALVEQAAQHTGVTLRAIDPAVPYPGKVEPEAVPDWFE